VKNAVKISGKFFIICLYLEKFMIIIQLFYYALKIEKLFQKKVLLLISPFFCLLISFAQKFEKG